MDGIAKKFITNKKLVDIASKNDLDVVVTTAARNGYPEYLIDAIIGFRSFEEAETFAAENGMDLVWIDKRDGWNFWHRGETAYEPMTITSDNFGDDYSFEDDVDEVKKWACAIIEDMASRGSYDDIRGCMNEMDKILNAIENLDDDQVVLTCQGRYDDTIKKHSIDFYYDGKRTCLAVIDFGIK